MPDNDNTANLNGGANKPATQPEATTTGKKNAQIIASTPNPTPAQGGPQQLKGHDNKQDNQQALENATKQREQLQEGLQKTMSKGLEPQGQDIWEKGKAMWMQAIQKLVAGGKQKQLLKKATKQINQIGASNTMKGAEKNMANGMKPTQALHKSLQDKLKKDGVKPTPSNMRKAMKNFTKNFVGADGKKLTKEQKDTLMDTVKNDQFKQKQKVGEDGKPMWQRDKAGDIVNDKDGKPMPLNEYTSELKSGTPEQASADTVIQGLEAKTYSKGTTADNTTSQEKTAGQEQSSNSTPTPQAPTPGQGGNTNDSEKNTTPSPQAAQGGGQIHAEKPNDDPVKGAIGTPGAADANAQADATANAANTMQNTP